MRIFLLIGMALGAAFMYFFDPQGGKQRRTLLKEQTTKAVDRSNAELPGRIQRLRTGAHRAVDIVNEAQSHLKNNPISERRLQHHIHDEMKKIVTNPDVIEITAKHGHIILTGPILAGEVQPLMTQIKAIRGVTEVEINLTVYEEVDDLPVAQEH